MELLEFVLRLNVVRTFSVFIVDGFGGFLRRTVTVSQSLIVYGDYYEFNLYKNKTEEYR